MTDYYFATAGDDTSGDGSIGSPWKTIEKAASVFLNLPNGSSINFNGGDTFTNTGGPSWESSATTNVRIIRSYGTGKATIVSNSGNHCFRIWGHSSAGGITIDNLILQGTTGSSDNGVWIYNKFVNFTISNCEIINCYQGVSMSGTDAGIRDNINILNNTFTQCPDQACFLSGNNITVDGNFMDRCGFYRNSLSHAIYVSFTVNVMISNNTIIDTGVTNYSNTPVIVGHGTIDQLTIENNIIRQPFGTARLGAYGVQLAPSTDYVVDELYTNVIIRDNVFDSIGKYGMSIENCQGLEVYNNVVTRSKDGDSRGVLVTPGADPDKSSNVDVHNNILYALEGISNPAAVEIDPSVPNQSEADNLMYEFTGALTAQIESMPQKGKFTAINPDGSFTYEYTAAAAPDSDSFTYVVNDSNGRTSPATVNLTVY